jgi:hypothetical protein
VVVWSVYISATSEYGNIYQNDVFGAFPLSFFSMQEVHCGTVDSGTVLQAGRLQVQFPKVLLEFFINIILPATLWSWG